MLVSILVALIVSIINLDIKYCESKNQVTIKFADWKNAPLEIFYDTKLIRCKFEMSFTLTILLPCGLERIG